MLGHGFQSPGLRTVDVASAWSTYPVAMNSPGWMRPESNYSISMREYGVEIEGTDDEDQAGSDPEHPLMAEGMHRTPSGTAVHGADGGPTRQRQDQYDDAETGADVRRTVAGGKQQDAVGNQTERRTSPGEQGAFRLQAGIRGTHRHSENSRPIRPTTPTVAPSINGSLVTGSRSPVRIADRFCCQRRKAPAVVTIPAVTRITPMMRAGQRSGPRSRNCTADRPPA